LCNPQNCSQKLKLGVSKHNTIRDYIILGKAGVLQGFSMITLPISIEVS